MSTQNKIRCDLSPCGCEKNSFIWVSDEKNLIFYENPKAASSLIKFNLKKHIKDLKNLDKLKPFHKNYFKFGFVRNPWDRMLSNWIMFTKTNMKQGQIERLMGKKNIKFDNFLELSQIHRNHHWEEQNRFIPINKLDYLGRIKTINDDLKKISQIIQIKISRKKMNATKHKKHKNYYNQWGKDLVGKIYKKDIDIFNFNY